jgi:hypothetical protein
MTLTPHQIKNQISTLPILGPIAIHHGHDSVERTDGESISRDGGRTELLLIAWCASCSCDPAIPRLWLPLATLPPCLCAPARSAPPQLATGRHRSLCAAASWLELGVAQCFRCEGTLQPTTGARVPLISVRRSSWLGVAAPDAAIPRGEVAVGARGLPPYQRPPLEPEHSAPPRAEMVRWPSRRVLSAGCSARAPAAPFAPTAQRLCHSPLGPPRPLARPSPRTSSCSSQLTLAVGQSGSRWKVCGSHTGGPWAGR